MPAIRVAFDNFFNIIETKETENGNIVMYSQSQSGVANPHTLDTLKAASSSAYSHVKKFADLLISIGNFNIIESKDLG